MFRGFRALLGLALLASPMCAGSLAQGDAPSAAATGAVNPDLKIADVLAAPDQWPADAVIELRGEYRGTRSRPGRPLENVPAPGPTYWILGDETGEVYVRNAPGREFYSAWTWYEGKPGHVSRPVYMYNRPEDLVFKQRLLHPDWTYGKRVIVRGHVVVHPDGLLTIDPTGIYKWQSAQGAFCVLETTGPPRSDHDPGGVMLRMIFKNDTVFPVIITSLAGFDHDFIVERDGREVWRWSRHRWTGGRISSLTVADDSWKPGPGSGLTDPSITGRSQTEPNRPTGRKSIPPDNSLVFVEYWPLTDNDGNPVPAGIYRAYGILSHRVFTYPVPVVIGEPAAPAR